MEAQEKTNVSYVIKRKRVALGKWRRRVEVAKKLMLGGDGRKKGKRKPD